ncbi:hypothetical protein EYF80_004684 [Liparis tanakae]|uniref:Uncharacterized protein n=1 Tax=Liparis tanakae TaxID=230148 RepID=A0A4Z2J4C2_9TELE|nr:hypothetical protein EYF80_004684 [Liparis tanakae]
MKTAVYLLSRTYGDSRSSGAEVLTVPVTGLTLSQPAGKSREVRDSLRPRSWSSTGLQSCTPRDDWAAIAGIRAQPGVDLPVIGV